MLYAGLSFEEAKIHIARDAGLQGYREGTRRGGRTAANTVVYAHA